MPFRFRLQKVLDYRQEIEKMEAQKLARYRSIRLEEERALDLLQKEGDELESFLRCRQESGLDIFSLQAAEHYSCQLQERIGQQEKKIEEAQRQENEQRAEVVEARRRAAVLEKLKEKKKEEYLEQEKLLEQKKVDEISLYRYIHGNRGN